MEPIGNRGYAQSKVSATPSPATTGGKMTDDQLNRRDIVTGSTVLGAASLLPGRAYAQAGAGHASQASTALPPRGEFVVRGANVLTMVPGPGELPSGAGHAPNGPTAGAG